MSDDRVYLTQCMSHSLDGFSLPRETVGRFIRKCRRCGGSVMTRDERVEFCQKIGMRALNEKCCPDYRPIFRVIKGDK